MNCENCAKTKPPEPVPYVVHESDMARLERTIKRLWILMLVLIALLAGSNAAWIYYESQFVDEVTTVEQDTESGYNNYIGNNGDIYNGETKIIIKRRTRKTGGNSGYRKCNMCHGTGRIKTR